MTETLNLVHFAAHPLRTLFNCEQKPEGATKPKGLWVSVEGDGDGWSDWCRDESFGLERLAVSQRIELAPDATILRISDAQGIDDFTQRHSVADGFDALPLGYRIDWRAVAGRHQGIIIAPYIWERRLTRHTHWYYGWDCASGCIWDTSAIAAVEDIFCDGRVT